MQSCITSLFSFVEVKSKQNKTMYKIETTMEVEREEKKGRGDGQV
jgi:hypothetical protein